MLDFCARERLAAVLFGGGSSVVGGVETKIAGDYRGVVTLDLAHWSRAGDRPRVARRAHPGGRARPALEEQLRPHGLTLRHYPQSFEFSSLGGWIATRSGGHFATHYTHMDEFVEALRIVTPTGVVATRRLPGSGAGPSPDRFFIGSEGTLGIITEAWMRLQDRPDPARQRERALRGFRGGVRAVRALSQSGLEPANCRLLDPRRGGDLGRRHGREAMLVLGFESADHALDAWMARAVELCRDHGGELPDGARAHPTDARRDARRRRGAWRNSSRRALLARRARRDRRLRRDLRDRHHLGSLRAPPRAHRRRRATRWSAYAARARSPAASPTSTPTAPRRITRCSRHPARQ